MGQNYLTANTDNLLAFYGYHVCVDKSNTGLAQCSRYCSKHSLDKLIDEVTETH